MNWSAVRFDWNQVRAFLATVEEGSLSAAARALGQSQPTLGRQVAALEEALGVVLFERVGRSLTLTPSGRELLDHVRAMGEAASRISLTASDQSQLIEGRVSISASEVFSAALLPRMLVGLREIAPSLDLEVVASNEISDLQRREADIAIRHIRPEGQELIAKSLGNASAHLYAAQSYLDRKGRPKTPEDLTAHDFVAPGSVERMIGFLSERGLPVSRAQFRTGSGNGIVAWELVRAGLGIAPMSDRVAASATGVERVLPELGPILFPVLLTVHRELHTSRRIRLVFDFLDQNFRRL